MPAEPIYDVVLDCAIGYDNVHHDAVSESCTTDIDANGVPWTNCTPGSDAFDSAELEERCLIRKFVSPDKTAPDDPAR